MLSRPKEETDGVWLAQTIALENRRDFIIVAVDGGKVRTLAPASSAFKSNSKSGGQCKLLFMARGCGRLGIGRSRCAADSFEWCANSLSYHSLFLSSSPPRGLLVNDCGSQGDNPGSSTRGPRGDNPRSFRGYRCIRGGPISMTAPRRLAREIV